MIFIVSKLRYFYHESLWLFLVACLMSLSPSGMATSMHSSTKENCCEKTACKHGQNQKQEKNRDTNVCN